MAEGVAIFLGVKVDLANFIDHLAHEGAGFHVVVSVFEEVVHHQGAPTGRAVGVESVFQVGKELGVDKVGQFVAGDAFGVIGPGTPTQVLGQGGLVVVFEKFQFGFAVVEYFKKEHPDHLADALGVAVDAHIFAHNVLDGFDDAGYVAHAVCSRLNSSCVSSAMALS